MNVPALLTELQHRGIEMVAVGDRIRVSPKGALSAEEKSLLREHRAEFLAELQRLAELRMEYARRFNGRGPSATEAAALETAVSRNGIALTYCVALGDLVAFVRTDAERKRVPAGFVVYTIEEAEKLCDLPIRSFKLIHEAKKLGGGRVLSVDPLDGGSTP